MPEINSLRQKFETGLETLVDLCHEAGLHSSEMIPALRQWLKWAEDAAREGDKQ